MYIRDKGSSTSKKTSLQICESFRKEDGKPSSRVLLTLGPKEQLIKSGQLEKLVTSLAKFLDSGAMSTSLFKDDCFEEVHRFNWGVPVVFKHLWQEFKLNDFFESVKSKVKFNFVDIIFLLAIDRFLEPRSKLQSFENREDYIGINSNIEIHHIYRSLDILSTLKAPLEKHLYDINVKSFKMKVNIVFFDATTLYFHSDKQDVFRRFGFSKDCKFKDVQIVLGLLMDQEGRPVGFQSFPGNTFDGSTLIKALENLKDVFKINKLILVGDRGICSKVNIKAIEKAGYEYIVATSLKKQEESLKKDILNLDSYVLLKRKLKKTERKDERDDEILKYREIILDDKQRLICTWSSKRARKDAHDREVFIEKANEIIEGKSKLKKQGKARYVVLEQKLKSLDKAKIEEDSKWDGFYGIITNNQKLSQETINDVYQQLWKIEDCFRTLKSHFKIRPIYHWTQKRIEGHLVLCFLVFVFERHLEIELKKIKSTISPEQIRKALKELQVSILQMGNKEMFSMKSVSKSGEEIFKAISLKVPTKKELKKEVKSLYKYAL